MVRAWYGIGIYYHLSQCYVNIGLGFFAAGSGTAWAIAAICGLSIVGDAGCSEIMTVVAGDWGLSAAAVAGWNAVCNSQGIGSTFVEPTWWHGSWAYPSC